MMNQSISMGSGISGYVPLIDQGVDFSNMTQAMNFLAAILDDTTLQVVDNSYATYFWFGIVVFIALASMVNFSSKLLLSDRLRAAAKNEIDPARPRSILTNSLATLNAVVREASYLQKSSHSLSHAVRVPPFGTIYVVLLYFGFILALEFTNNNLPGAQHNQALGLRAGWLAVSQIPLLVLLSGKASVIGLLVGTSYERLNVYHRWVSRGLLLLTSMHFGFQSVGWANYGLMQLEWKTDTCPPTGIAAYALVLWMNLSTLRPFRKMSYKLFVIQHIVTFWGFIIATMEHLPSTAFYSRVYIWIAIGLYCFDKSVRTLIYVWTNITPVSAKIENLDNAAIKITLLNPRIKSWSAGSHVRLRFLKFDFWHTHPATILSRPDSQNGELVFILRARGWMTRTILKLAKSQSTHSVNPEVTCKVLMGLPFLSPHNDFAAFDTVVFVAGGSGITFTIAILQDFAHRVRSHKLPLRRIDFVWAVRRVSWASWIDQELQRACEILYAAGIETNTHIYVTGIGEQIDGGADKRDKTQPNSIIHQLKTEASAECDTHRGQKDMSLQTTFHSGRPNLLNILNNPIENGKGESAVCACGPFGLIVDVRNCVVKISDDRAVHKGTGSQGIYLHVVNTDAC